MLQPDRPGLFEQACVLVQTSIVMIDNDSDPAKISKIKNYYGYD